MSPVCLVLPKGSEDFLGTPPVVSSVQPFLALACPRLVQRSAVGHKQSGRRLSPGGRAGAEACTLRVTSEAPGPGIQCRVPGSESKAQGPAFNKSRGAVLHTQDSGLLVYGARGELYLLVNLPAAADANLRVIFFPRTEAALCPSASEVTG